MPITLTYENVDQLRTEMANLFPALAATVPVTQAPTPAAKEAIAIQEEHNAALAALNEAQSNLKKLESAYSTQADLLRETQEKLKAAREGEAPTVQNDAADRAVFEACTILGSLPDATALPALVAEMKGERDQAQAALKDAQDALEGAQLEVKRLRDLGVGTPAETERPKTRKRAPKANASPEEQAAGEAAEAEAEAAQVATFDPTKFPANFTSLPDLPEGEVAVGTGVIICIESSSAPGGWLTPGGIVERRFEGTNRYEVKLVHGGYHAVHRDAMRAVTDAPRTVNPDLQAPLERAPVTPLVEAKPNDAAPDRLATDDERKELKALADRLKLKPEQVIGLIQKHFAPKTSSAELTVTELDQLREHMDREASIPF